MVAGPTLLHNLLACKAWSNRLLGLLYCTICGPAGEDGALLAQAGQKAEFQPPCIDICRLTPALRCRGSSRTPQGVQRGLMLGPPDIKRIVPQRLPSRA